jgi:Ca-activated chloride channel family protein
VDSLKVVIGDRVIVGDVKARQEARETYERARNAGHKAGLIEQERPNLFTSSVANIGPGETVLVQIEYQEPVHQTGDEFSLRVPLVVAPRYSPAPIMQTVALDRDGRGWGQVADPVPDRDRISPPVLDPKASPPTNPVSILVRLQAGFPISEVKSAHHAVKVEADGDDGRTVTLRDGQVPADRDFELTWRPAARAAPAVGLFREHVGDADYLLAFVTPPPLPPAPEGTEQKQQQPAVAREIVFVIDNSGSMAGTSIMQAKASLGYALDRLSASDRFNVIRFDNTMEALFDDTVPADRDHIARAKSFVDRIEASGGTEMVPPMQAALTDPRADDVRHVRQVVFLTDGEIGNEQQLFDTIGGMRGRSRVFMVGIGSAPNTFLMTRAAEIGRGTFTHIGSVDEVEERMRALFEKLASPIVTSLAATFAGVEAEVTPAVIPDVYRGEPVVLAAKVPASTGTLALSGMIGERPWTITLPLADAAEGKGISKLWARRNIEDAEVLRTLGRMSSEEADRRVLALALAHHLVTRLTSLVAVDQTPSRPEGAHLTRADIPLDLPAGWDFEKVFGHRPAAAPGDLPHSTPPERRADASGSAAPSKALVPVLRDVPPAAGAVVVAAAHDGVVLPKTATDADLKMLIGLAFCLLGLLLSAADRLWRCGLRWRGRGTVA